MQVPSENQPGTNGQVSANGTYLFPLIVMVTLFFLFGFVTVLNDVLIPHLKGLFALTNLQAMLVQFCFFGAYFLLSVPAGYLLAYTGYKKGIVLSLCVVAAGLLLFIPASYLISYPVFLFALFVIGSGITVLQVAANPYISALGPLETGATRLSLAGFLNSLAATIGPVIGAYLIFVSPTASPEVKAESVRVPYMVLAGFVLLLSFIISRLHLPEIFEKTEQGNQSQGSVFRHKHLVLGALGIFFYVGVEVSVGSMLIGYLGTPLVGGLSHEQAAQYVSYYWGAAMVGRLFGFLFTKSLKPQNLLTIVTIPAILFLAGAIFIHGMVSVYFLIALGLMHSVMWPCIFPLSIKGLGSETNKGSGLLVTMVVGGAVVPVLQGLLIDAAGYSNSFWLLMACYLYILFFALKGYKPLNK